MNTFWYMSQHVNRRKFFINWLCHFFINLIIVLIYCIAPFVLHFSTLFRVVLLLSTVHQGECIQQVSSCVLLMLSVTHQLNLLLGFQIQLQIKRHGLLDTYLSMMVEFNCTFTSYQLHQLVLAMLLVFIYFLSYHNQSYRIKVRILLIL